MKFLKVIRIRESLLPSVYLHLAQYKQRKIKVSPSSSFIVCLAVFYRPNPHKFYYSILIGISRIGYDTPALSL